MPAFLVQLIVVLIIVGLLLYVARLLPIDETIKRIITAIVVVAIVIWLLYALLGSSYPALSRWPCR